MINTINPCNCIITIESHAEFLKIPIRSNETVRTLSETIGGKTKEYTVISKTKMISDGRKQILFLHQSKTVKR